MVSKSVVFVDTEVGTRDKKIHDAGACKFDGSKIHTNSPEVFESFVKNDEYFCGHNIYGHDLKYIQQWIGKDISPKLIDTLYLSPLLFPQKPYHRLVKDDKLQVDELNNPLNDSLRAMELFNDELSAYAKLTPRMKRIYTGLLSSAPEFSGFFDYVDSVPYSYGLDEYIKGAFYGKICEHANISAMVKSRPVELAYALAIIDAYKADSITPPWVLRQYPNTENIIKLLRNTPCKEGCAYCKTFFDHKKALKRIFGYDEFRTFDGEPLQENAVKAAIEGESLLAVFPTGGGKSITFQLPALISGDVSHGLTVVISPLQSLMKDQVDNLTEKGIYTAVTVNGLLDPVERKKAIDLVMNGLANILYISPESLRSKTIEKILLSRNVVRFVIDEAHCFSAWGQDFRVDYMYIGDFIKKLQEKKMLSAPIPVSCFTATAKQKVIADINDYFREKLGINLKLFTSAATRRNLHYTVMFEESDNDKYQMLRSLIESKDCPTIVYVSRTKKTKEIADRLTRDGFPALPFNGKMDPDEKVNNQEAFINNEVKIIVATSAFGMGVDKSDVKLVVHYDISDSLENYIQEAGRAGRDPSLEAECYVLYNNDDLDKHFMLLNQTKLSLSEIQQVWSAVKTLTKQRNSITCSALEIARQAGWDDVSETETRVRTAILALENAGYVERGQNVPKVYATSILTTSMTEASRRIENSSIIVGDDKLIARRVLSNLIGKRSIAKADNDEAESRVDYIADRLGLDKAQVIYIINLMRQDGLLANDSDMSAFILDGDNHKKAMGLLRRFSNLEYYLLDHLDEKGFRPNYKEINDDAVNNGVNSSVKNIKTLFYFFTISKCLEKKVDEENNCYIYRPLNTVDNLKAKASRRLDICNYIIDTLYEKADKTNTSNELPVEFSLVELYNGYKDVEGSLGLSKLQLSDIEDALLYLSKIGAMKIEGGFLVSYNGMEIHRLIENNAIKYKKEDYRKLDEYYQQRIQQIHIVGKYANLMVQDYDTALQFVSDYFQMNYTEFILKYFKGNEAKEIQKNITPKKYNQLFKELSEKQLEIISDDESKYIVVAAGPGSGKTKVLVHKLASLLLMEDVKHEQLLMLTFSRSAAIEFRKRLYELIGAAAKRVEINTFHSYCFDLIGRIGSIEDSDDVIREATKLINEGESEPGKITKKVLVIDEAQDMDADEFALVEALIKQNDNLRVIAVGDDDQNIYEFRGSSSKYLYKLLVDYEAKLYEMDDNYRSCKEVVALANAYSEGIKQRMKQHPISAVKTDRGYVALVHHTGKNMVSGLVSDVKNTFNRKETACVLTNNNEEAFLIMGLLHEAGIEAKLIQSLDGFDLSDLIEVRYFLDYIKSKCGQPNITDDIWENACKHLEKAFAKSKNLDVCKRMIQVFDDSNAIKFKSDLETFFKESKLEDFDETKSGVVSVSTIHKAKGREFDYVYMYLSNTSDKKDEEKHKLYVGITRAKKYLSIHYNNSLFTRYILKEVSQIEDSHSYPDPDEMLLQLTHRDVFLGYFKSRQKVVDSIYAGDKLKIKDGYFYVDINGKETLAGAFSKALNDRLAQLKASGYVPDYGEVRFIVKWEDKEENKEYSIILPDVHLKKL